MEKRVCTSGARRKRSTPLTVVHQCRQFGFKRAMSPFETVRRRRHLG
jgi:hypothetical protein